MRQTTQPIRCAFCNAESAVGGKVEAPTSGSAYFEPEWPKEYQPEPSAWYVRVWETLLFNARNQTPRIAGSASACVQCGSVWGQCKAGQLRRTIASRERYGLRQQYAAS